MSKPKSKGHRSGCFPFAGGVVCMGDSRPARVKKRETLNTLKNSGKGPVTITADDVHLLRNIIQTIDEQPECSGVYGTKQNGNTAALMKRVEAQVCDICGGGGWNTVDMGEGAAPCFQCGGSGLAKKAPPKSKAGRVTGKAK